MTNRKYILIKGYTKIAIEEIVNTLEYSEKEATEILLYAIKDIRGQHLNKIEQEWLFGRTSYLDTYILVYTLAEELSKLMDGGVLPEGA
jgi:hypothetical protein